MDDQTKSRFTSQTLVAQALGVHEPVTEAIVPPIHMAATYLRDADNGYRAGYVYGRTDNVSVQQAENLIAALEGAEEALRVRFRHGRSHHGSAWRSTSRRTLSPRR